MPVASSRRRSAGSAKRLDGGFEASLSPTKSRPCALCRTPLGAKWLVPPSRRASRIYWWSEFVKYGLFSDHTTHPGSLARLQCCYMTQRRAPRPCTQFHHALGRCLIELLATERVPSAAVTGASRQFRRRGCPLRCQRHEALKLESVHVVLGTGPVEPRVGRKDQHPVLGPSFQPPLFEVLSASAAQPMMFFGTPNELILAPLAMKFVKYRPEDFRLVALACSGPMLLLARPDLGSRFRHGTHLRQHRQRIGLPPHGR